MSYSKRQYEDANHRLAVILTKVAAEHMMQPNSEEWQVSLANLAQLVGGMDKAISRITDKWLDMQRTR